MVWRFDEFPSADHKANAKPIDDIAGWQIWEATGPGPPYTAWQILDSRTHNFSQAHPARFLLMRVFYTTKLASDTAEVPQGVYSDIMEGWDWYAFRFIRGGKAVQYWRADNEAELDQHRHRSSDKIAGALMTDAAWAAILAEALSGARRFGWV